MEAPLPPSPQSVSVPSVPQQKSGCGKGCLIALLIGLLLAVVAGAGGCYFYRRAIALFTAPQPVEIRIEQPSDAVFQAAAQKLDRLRRATSSNQEVTIEFTATDLNALIAREPGFRGAKNHAHFEMSDSIMVMDSSVPLESVPLPGLRGRWFNGTIRFGLSVDRGEFTFNTRSIRANDQDVPEVFFRVFIPSFNRSFTRGFQRALQNKGSGDFFWKRIKAIDVEGNKLVVTTQQS